MLWNIIQHEQIRAQNKSADSLEKRVQNLEEELFKTRKSLHKLTMILEKKFGEDLDGDNKIG